MKRRVEASDKVQSGRFFRTILPAAAILLVGIGVIFGVLIYKVSYPGAVPESVDPSYYSLPSLEISIPSGNGLEFPGWWIPGLKDAPGIVLAPGYGMCHSDALSLAAVLHQNGFNLLVYAQRGSGASPRGASTLGLHEDEDMAGAIRFLQGRRESNRARLGIWGTDVGALAALKAAAAFPAVRAIAADSVFESVADFLDYRIAEDFGLENRLIQYGCHEIYRLAHIFDGVSMNERLDLQALADRTILFIKGENCRALGSSTAALYDKIRPQKEMISFKTARVHLMSGEDLRSYDRQVANFFHLNLQ
jgi:pimeloyl-ACP methyl ester carboxylesterase